MKHLFLFIMLFFSNLQALDYAILQSRNSGMFSGWMTILSLIHSYEEGNFSGFEIAFDKKGLYYDPDYGDNWWEYYCESVQVGYVEDEIVFLLANIPHSKPWINRQLTRDQARAYIDKYIHVKPFILNMLKDFERENFYGSYVISVHYRGTDKFEHESFPVPYDEAKNQVNKVIQNDARKSYKIFVATDEQSFLEYMINAYGEKVCYLPNVNRSTDGKPLHYAAKSPYQHGLEAVMDCLLLSKGDYLIRTTSNLSKWSMFFNPEIPVYELNQLDFH